MEISHYNEGLTQNSLLEKQNLFKIKKVYVMNSSQEVSQIPWSSNYLDSIP
jgi:hypothetical protein